MERLNETKDINAYTWDLWSQVLVIAMRHREKGLSVLQGAWMLPRWARHAWVWTRHRNAFWADDYLQQSGEEIFWLCNISQVTDFHFHSELFSLGLTSPPYLCACEQHTWRLFLGLFTPPQCGWSCGPHGMESCRQNRARLPAWGSFQNSRKPRPCPQSLWEKRQHFLRSPGAIRWLKLHEEICHLFASWNQRVSALSWDHPGQTPIGTPHPSSSEDSLLLPYCAPPVPPGPRRSSWWWSSPNLSSPSVHL